ncbi:UvrD-helicase domain-containing protein [Desulfonatronum thioautotrophicum]|uniref:UvrD-helicase domain-containing protein n=1 Tax=Desulfonatronum thioautotrophicum TaxID=617001 RepID=UPI00069ABE9E|nr:UvrD-helicase domain-containing protein [Desulfonatronum thioautotrophicum]
MKVLIYNELTPGKIPGFKKVASFLENGDFRSAEVKKLAPNLFRARLDKSDRLLFSLYRHNGETCILALEHIPNHAYEKSRFLRGAAIQEDKIPVLGDPETEQPEDLVYLNPASSTFHLLDKILSFDDLQQAVFTVPPPLIVIGSAGSGKTALTLEKMKLAAGDVLYVTTSPYLIQSARNIYHAYGYANESQNIDFLSYQEFLESIRVPQGRELTFREFEAWISRQRLSRELRDAHQLYEEFKGVLTGSADAAHLSQEQYLGLGVKQSIYPREQRGEVYDVFRGYLRLLQDQGCYDVNMLSHAYADLIQPRYDFAVVDEVQDLTAVQLQLILRSLRKIRNFILCGDSNQIVHPNFFSWARVKSFFYAQEDAGPPSELIRILNTNYRNSPEITELANRILKMKNARFGSVDRESNYLVHSTARESGKVLLLRGDPSRLREMGQRARTSTRYAVIVLHPEQKAAAKAAFGSPLVFSIQEAKGLEYENVILFNFTSSAAKRFAEITSGVTPDQLQGEDLNYGRTKDKSDKSLEIYKFYINALYVAVTRAVTNLFWMESEPEHELFSLLGLEALTGKLDLDSRQSSLDEWRQEAHKLELQGKQEQAEAIRRDILKQKTPPWKVLVDETLAVVEHNALVQGEKKSRLQLFDYALVYNDQKRLHDLRKVGFAPADKPDKGLTILNQKHFYTYELKQSAAVMRQVDDFGVDFRDVFNQTPLMNAARMGNADLVKRLLEAGADTSCVNSAGFNAFRIVLEQAVMNSKYAARKLPELYDLLVPDSMSVQVEGKLIKIDKISMDFFLLNLMMAMFYVRFGVKYLHQGGRCFETADFIQVMDPFPESVLLERRKKRPYLSSILAKNEMNRDGPYNRRLFVRMRQGNYLFNPRLSLRVEGQWRNIYDVLNVNMLYVRFDLKNMDAHRLARIENITDNNLLRLRTWLDKMRQETEGSSSPTTHPEQS